MRQWEYLFLEISGHNKLLREAQNMLVTTSDGRWRGERMPTDVYSMFNRLGAEGWELVSRSGHEGEWAAWPVPQDAVGAVFKRQKG